MAGLVVGGTAPVFRAHHHLARGAEDDPLQRIREIGFGDDLVIPPRGKQRRLVDEVGQIGAHHPRRARGNARQVDVRSHPHPARVHLQDRLAAGAVGRLHGDAAVEAARPEKCRVEHVGPVGRADHDHLRGRVEAVHLGQDLVERLLALVVAAAEAGDPGSA